MHNQTCTTAHKISLNTYGDTAPYNELCTKRITPEHAQNMEGLLTIAELTRVGYSPGAREPGSHEMLAEIFAEKRTG